MYGINKIFNLFVKLREIWIYHNITIYIWLVYILMYYLFGDGYFKCNLIVGNALGITWFLCNMMAGISKLMTIQWKVHLFYYRRRFGIRAMRCDEHRVQNYGSFLPFIICVVWIFQSFVNNMLASNLPELLAWCHGT